MFGSAAMTRGAAMRGAAHRAAMPLRLKRWRPGVLLSWAAFRIVCLRMRTDPVSVARMLGAERFDAGFGFDARGSDRDRPNGF